jgi:hypothetical protein
LNKEYAAPWIFTLYFCVFFIRISSDKVVLNLVTDVDSFTHETQE